jgi:hypothetical protein
MNPSGAGEPFATAIAVRGFSRPHQTEKEDAPDPAARRRAARRSDLFVVLDCETRIDHTQRLLFASARLYSPDGLLREWLTYPDDLSADELGILRRYVDKHPDDRGGQIDLLPEREFTRLVLGRLAYKERAKLVFWNGPFDLSRFALDWRPAQDTFAGGFSLRMAEWTDDAGNVRPDKWLPNIRIKALGSKRERVGFAAAANVDEWHLDPGGFRYRGRFLDLHQLAYALTDRSYTLEAAAKAFGLPPSQQKGRAPKHGVLTERYIDYNRQDVRTTAALHEALLAEWKRHPIELEPERAYSAATVGRAYLSAMGIRPLLERSDVEPRYLGYAMSAYFGGRAEIRIRRTPVPIRYVDFTSMYPTVFELLGLWSWLTAERLAVRNASVEAQEFVSHITNDDLFEPAAWRELAGVFCLVRPDGELLPVRADYSADSAAGRYSITGAPTIGLNSLTSERPLWYTLADVVAAKILGGRAPQILEAFRLVPEGTDPGLRPVALRGELVVDPRVDSLFRIAIEERNRLRHSDGPDEDERERKAGFLKTLANADAYGIFAQMDVGEPTADGTLVEVDGLWHLDTRVTSTESPGPYCFPPLAASITGAGRLLLALLEHEVERRGGTYMGCDTDSLLIVAGGDGGLVPCLGGAEQMPDSRPAIRALSESDVDAIVGRFTAISPYDRAAVPSLLKIEDENKNVAAHRSRTDLWGVGISAKRFVLYERTEDGYVLRKASEHGLGLYRRPVGDGKGWSGAAPRWIETAWRRIIDEIEGHPPGPELAWFGRPALGQITTSTWNLLRPFVRQDRERERTERVRPFNFMLVGHADPLVPLPDELDGRHATPVAPYSTKPSEFLSLAWRNRVDGTPIEVTTRQGGEPGKVRLRTYRDVIRHHRLHPEAKSGDPEGGPCNRGTVGLMPRRPVLATMIRHIGKESNQLEEAEHEVELDLDAVLIQYADERAEWEGALPALRKLRDQRGWRLLADASGLSEREIRYALNGGKMPHPQARRGLLALGAGANVGWPL